MSFVPTQAKSKVSVSVDGVDMGSFQTKGGGERDSENMKTRPGGGEAFISYGNPAETGNITVAKLQDSFIQGKVVWIKSIVGKAKMVVTDQPLDADNNPFGSPHVESGILKRFAPASRDANSSDWATCEFEMTVGE